VDLSAARTGTGPMSSAAASVAIVHRPARLIE
jgi:hypothetical protein